MATIPFSLRCFLGFHKSVTWIGPAAGIYSACERCGGQFLMAADGSNVRIGQFDPADIRAALAAKERTP